jgi:hypothetical protein
LTLCGKGAREGRISGFYKSLSYTIIKKRCPIAANIYLFLNNKTGSLGFIK